MKRAERLWRGAAASAYLDTRSVGHLIGCIDPRSRADCQHPSCVCLPALIAAVRDVDGRFVGIHRTYSRRDGTGKADVEPQKASIGRLRGGAVQLATIEQMLAAGELHTQDGPCWVGMPTQVQIGGGGGALRDQRGKLKYDPALVSFASKEVRDWFSAQVVGALRLAHPKVFATEGAVP
jgi:hypothetical protein